MRRATATALVLFALLSLLLTHPLALHLGSAVEDRQDALLNVWITAWDGHQLLSDPLHLFDANIFHPYPRTLAYSELLLGNGILALPIIAISGNPVLGYNLLLLASFCLSGLGVYLLALKLTRSPAAGLVAGLIFAYSAYRMTNLAQAQLLTTQWMPFALLSLYQLVRRPRPRHIVTFTLFFSLQALSSFYYAILLALAVAGFAAWLLAVRTFPLSRRTTGYLLLAVLAITLITLPFALPYFQVQRDLGFQRALADSEPFSASLRQYLMVPPSSLFHGAWLPSESTPRAGGYPVDALFPGVIAMLLAAWGVVRGKGRTRWFFLLLLIIAFLLSLGPRLFVAPGLPASWDAALPYAWLYSVVPGMGALRAPVRFAALVILAVAVLAGYGVAALRSEATQNHRIRRVAIPALLVVLVLVESSVWPGSSLEGVAAGDDIPYVYHWLAHQPDGPLMELPMAFTSGGPQLDYQYFSTVHWRTTPDGYSGFVPPKHGQIIFEMQRFPSERSVSLLQALGVSQVVVHTDRYTEERWSAMQSELEKDADIEFEAAFGQDLVYTVHSRAMDSADLEIRGYLPPRAETSMPYTAYLIIVNHGDRSYAVSPVHDLQVVANWQDVAGSLTEHVSTDVPLVTSPDGGVAVIPIRFTAPSEPGNYELSLAPQSGQQGDWFLHADVDVSRADEGWEPDASFPVPAQLIDSAVPRVAKPGETVPVYLRWRALGKIDAYYSVYVKLVDADGNAIASWDGQPQGGDAATLLWAPGETVDDMVHLSIPEDAAPGAYDVEVGMYRASDLARALTLDAGGTPVDRVLLGHLQVQQ